jgi:hypothetical protein
MRSTNTLALKEWAVIVRALAMGKQTILLRKGGLHERRGQFSADAHEFFLFPTYTHQMVQGIVGMAATNLPAIMATQPPAGYLGIGLYATVEDCRWLDTRTQVDTLADLHCWTPATIAYRFIYGKTPGMYLFVLRVYRLPEAQILPMHKRYGGCRSWVDLDQALSTAGATPVLRAEEFTEYRQRIHERLTTPRTVMATTKREHKP